MISQSWQQSVLGSSSEKAYCTTGKANGDVCAHRLLDAREAQQPLSFDINYADRSFVSSTVVDFMKKA